MKTFDPCRCFSVYIYKSILPVYVCVRVCACARAYVCMCMCVYAYLHSYTCIYIHIHTSLFRVVLSFLPELNVI